MLKFLRKYQKWMLVVFCAGLMVAFLAPQAAQQFVPEPAKRTKATTFNGKNEINEIALQRAANDLSFMRGLRLDRFNDTRLSLLPDSGSDSDDALIWLLIQQAADHNKLGASVGEARALIASVRDVDPNDEDAFAAMATELSTSPEALIALGKQYLKAEQFRQLVAGIEYAAPKLGENETGSPGLRRLLTSSDAIRAMNNQVTASLSSFGMSLDQVDQNTLAQLSSFAFQNVFFGNDGYFARINGHGRVSSAELRHNLQTQLTELDLTVAELSVDDRLETTQVDEAYIKEVFKRFAEFAPGTGPEFGLGYREPERVKLEALRIPIEAVRAREIELIREEEASDEDSGNLGVLEFYNQHKSIYDNALTYADGTPKMTKKLDAVLREELAQTVAFYRSQFKAVEIAERARQILNEQARKLEKQGPFRVVPADFAPKPLAEVVKAIEEEFGVRPEIIEVKDWVSAGDIRDRFSFNNAFTSATPTSTIRFPDARNNTLRELPLPSATLGGVDGLLSTQTVSLARATTNTPQRIVPGDLLSNYILTAKTFVGSGSTQAGTGLQAKLAGEPLQDASQSTYVFRITQAQASRPATMEDFAKQAEEVLEDAKRIKAYENLIADEEALLKQAAAADASVKVLLPEDTEPRDLSGMTRRTLNNPQFIPRIAGVPADRVLREAFGKIDKLKESGGLDAAEPEQRLFSVKLPGQYTLLIVSMDAYRPLTKQAYRAQANRPMSLLEATLSKLGTAPENPLSLEAMQRYTDFKWEEGYEDSGDDEDGLDDADSDDDD